MKPELNECEACIITGSPVYDELCENCPYARGSSKRGGEESDGKCLSFYSGIWNKEIGKGA